MTSDLEAIAGLAVRVVVEANVAIVTVGREELRSTLALAGAILAVTSVHIRSALTGLARVHICCLLQLEMVAVVIIFGSLL